MKKEYNTDFYKDKYTAFDTTSAAEFINTIRYFNNIGYKILKYALTEEGSFKFLAILKKKPLVKCCLLEKKISKNDRVYPKNNTCPERCEYYKNGTCCCIDHNFCLYQDTEYNKHIIQKMVAIYDNHNDDTCIMFEDTKYGRIYSREYHHLNTRKDENIPKIHRHNGN